MTGRDALDALAAITAHPMTAAEVEAVFPHWRPGHGARRLTDLVGDGLARRTATTRATIPGRRPGHVYQPTPTGAAVADPWTGPDLPAAIDAAAWELEHTGTTTVRSWPCLYCPHRSSTRSGAIFHEQRGHGLPRVDATTGKARP